VTDQGSPQTPVFDYSYVVMRKPENGRFIWPSQMMPE
jgi:hypothetical protein